MPGIRQILVILGVILLFRLIGKVMTARRSINEQKSYQKESNAKKAAQENMGKTSISKIDKKNLKDSDFTKFEEVD